MRRSISARATTAADLLAVALVDLLGARRDVLFGRLLFLGEERLELLAQLVEDREVVGEVVEDRVDDLARSCGRAGRRWPIAGDQPRPACASCVDEQARRVRLLREERAVEHRRLEHRDLQAREQRLDAVGKVLRLEDEVEQHRDHLDGHRFELVRLLAERRVLQVAQDVVHALRDAGELRRARRRRRSRTGPPAAASGLRAGRRVEMIGAPGT